METQSVGIREFRDNLATYILEATAPIAITRHGDYVGLFIPAPPKRTDADWASLEQSASRWKQVLDADEISEEEIMEDLKRLKAGRKRLRTANDRAT